jgi:hypothetical protein
MGVEIRTEGRLVILRPYGELRGRDAVAWTEAVRTTFAVVGTPIGLLCELAPDVKVPISQLASGCRAAFPVGTFIEACALVACSGGGRSLLRAALSVISPRYPVAFFDDMENAKAWLATAKRAYTTANA